MALFQKPKKNQRSEVLAAIDIGTSKVCCSIARPIQTANKTRVQILGFGQQASKGVRNGAIVDLEQLEDAIVNAVHTAEQAASRNIRSVFINLPTPAVQLHRITTKIQLSGHTINDQHIHKLIKASRDFTNIRERQIIHIIPTTYTLDEATGILDPRGMVGETLQAKLSVLTTPTGLIRNISSCMKRCHLDINGFVAGGYASGLSTLVEDELSLGVTIIDIGGGSTTLASFIDGALIDLTSIPIGGEHLTKDIARVLATPISQAERLKNLYGTLLPISENDRESIIIPQLGENASHETPSVSKFYLSEIIRARVEEIFDYVKKRIHTSNIDQLVYQRIVLTGGVSQLSGIRELASDKLGGQVRIGSPNNLFGDADSMKNPSFATCSGLLQFGVDDQQSSNQAELILANLSASSNIFSKAVNWVRENF
jgi:cell division protein FtsA